MTTTELQKKLIELHEDKGVMYNHFANVLGLSKTTINLYINNKREISRDKEEQLIEYIENNYR